MDTLIINNGSGYIKWGLNNNIYPTLNIPNLSLSKDDKKHSKCPIINGIVSDWDKLSDLWESSLITSNIKSEEHRLLISLPLSYFDKEKLYEILFEYFNFKSVYIGDPNCLTLYSTGRTTGLIYDCGHHLTQINPVFEGYHLDTNSRLINLGGYDIDQFLINQIQNSGISLPSLSYTELHTLKHTLNKHSITSFQLPDGQSIQCGQLKKQDLTEILFNPLMIGKDIKDCGYNILETIQQCDLNVRNQLRNNIILSGGTTLLGNFQKRLTQSLSAYSSTKIKIIKQPNQHYLQWQGGSIISQLSIFNQLSVTKNDFYELKNTKDKYREKNISIN